jgi:hypothetical protein
MATNRKALDVLSSSENLRKIRHHANDCIIRHRLCKLICITHELSTWLIMRIKWGPLSPRYNCCWSLNELSELRKSVGMSNVDELWPRCIVLLFGTTAVFIQQRMNSRKDERASPSETELTG